jgi:hypothetical protein
LPGVTIPNSPGRRSFDLCSFTIFPIFLGKRGGIDWLTDGAGRRGRSGLWISLNRGPKPVVAHPPVGRIRLRCYRYVRHTPPPLRADLESPPMLPIWLRTLFPQSPGRAARRRPGRPAARPRLVELEARVTPVVAVVQGVTAVPSSGFFRAGDTISVQVTFDVPVDVTGTPQLTLETGATDETVNYTGGTGTATLTFAYTVQPGDTSADLDYTSTTALSANGGTIQNAGTDADLTLPAPGAAGSLGANAADVIDTAAPVLQSVAGPANGMYKIGDALTLTAAYDGPVTVTTAGGTPRIPLTVGAATVFAGYTGGSGTANLTFAYTVQTGDLDTDGIAVVSPLQPNGGTIRDAAGNDATTTFAPPNTAGVLVDGVAPTITTVTGPANGSYRAGQNLDFTVTYDDAVDVTGTPQIPLTVGATPRTADYVAGTGTGTLTFRYTVQPGDTDTDGITSASPIALNGGTIRDGAGNDAGLTFAPPNTAGVLVDTTAPTATVGPVATPRGSPAGAVPITFSEAVTGVDTPDFTLTRDGSPVSLAGLTVAGSGANYSLDLTTVTATPGSYVLTLVAAGSGIQDAAGNPLAADASTAFTVVPSVSVSVAPATAPEVGGTLTYTLTRTGPTAAPLTVNVSFGGAATLGTDYTQTGVALTAVNSGTVTFGAGQATATVTVTGVDDLTFEGDEAVSLSVDPATPVTYAVGTSPATAALTDDDTAGGATYTLPAAGAYSVVLNGANLEIRQGATVLASRAIATLAAGGLVVNGTAGNDTLTVDFGGGNPVPAGGLTFNGGNPTTPPGDALAVAGGAFGTVAVRYTTAHDGTVTFDGASTVNFIGLEPVLLNVGSVQDAVFTLPAAPPGPSSATLSSNASGQLVLSANPATFETTTFTNPANSLTINAGVPGPGGDALTLSPAVRIRNLSVGAGGAFRAVTVANSPLAVDGLLQVAAGDVALDAPTSAAVAQLTASNGLTQTAPLAAGVLALGGSANFLLNGATNAVGSVGANTAGDVRLRNAGGTLTVTASNTNTFAVDQAGSISVTGDVTATATGAAAVGFAATGDLSAAPGVTIASAAGNSFAVGAGGLGGTLNLDRANVVSTVGVSVARGGAGSDTFFISRYTDALVLIGDAPDTLFADVVVVNAQGGPFVQTGADTFTAGGNAVRLSGIEAVRVFGLPAAGPAVTVTGTAGDDSVALETVTALDGRLATGVPRPVPTYLAVLNGVAFPRVFLPTDSILPLPTFTFDSGKGADRLVVRLKAGEDLPFTRVNYNGQGANGAGDQDYVQVLGPGLVSLGGGGTTDAVVRLEPTVADAGVGTVTVNGKAIVFNGLSAANARVAGVDVGGFRTATVTFATPGTAAGVDGSVSFLPVPPGGPANALRVTGTTTVGMAPVAFTPVAAWANGTLAIDTTGAAGGDTVAVNDTRSATDPTGLGHLNTNLLVNTGLEATDKTIFAGPASFAGDVTLKTSFGVAVTAPLTAGGSVSVLAGGTITVYPGVTVTAAAGNIRLSADADLTAGGATLSAAKGGIALRVGQGASQAATPPAAGGVARLGRTAFVTGSPVTVTGGFGTDEFQVDAGYVGTTVSVDGGGATNLLRVNGRAVTLTAKSAVAGALTSPGRADLVFDNITRMRLDGAGVPAGPAGSPDAPAQAVVVRGDYGGVATKDDFAIMRTAAGGGFAVAADGLPVDTVALLDIRFLGLAEDDTLTAAYSAAGSPNPGAFAFDGGPPGKLGNTFVLNGPGDQRATFTADPAVTASGTLTTTGTDLFTLTSAQTARVTNFTDLAYTPAAGGNSLTIGEVPGFLTVGGTTANGTVGLTAVQYRGVPGVAGSLTVDAAATAGPNAVRVVSANGLAADVAALTVRTGAGSIGVDGLVTFAGPVRLETDGPLGNGGTVASTGASVALLAGGDLTSAGVSAGTAAVLRAGGNLIADATTAGGDAGLTAGGRLVVGTLAKAGGTLTLSAGGSVGTRGATLTAGAAIAVRYGQAGNGSDDDFRDATITAPAVAFAGGGGFDAVTTTRLTSPATFAGTEAVTLLGTDGADKLAVRTAAARGPFEFQSDALTAGLPVQVPGIRRFEFDGRGSDDCLTLDTTNGDPTPAGGLTYRGDDGTDALAVIGTRQDATFTADAKAASVGTLRLGGAAGPVGLFDVEGLDLDRFGPVTVAEPGPAAKLALADGPQFCLVGNANSARLTGTASAGPVTGVAVSNAAGLTVDTSAGPGTAAVAVGPLTGVSAAVGALTLTGNPAGDRVTFAGGTTFAGPVTVNVAATLGTAAAVTSVTDAVTFNGAVDGPGGLTVSAGGDVTFAGPVGAATRVGTLTVATARNVTAGSLTADAFVQQAGTGTTTLNGPVRITGGAAVMNFAGGAANGASGGGLSLSTRNVVFAGAVSVPSAPVLVQLDGGDGTGTAKQTAGSIATRAVYLAGSGTFALEQPGNHVTGDVIPPAAPTAPGAAQQTIGGLFVNLATGEVRYRDAGDLTLTRTSGRNEPTGASAPGVQIGAGTGTGDVVLTVGRNFTANTAIAGQKAATLFAIPGTLQVYVGASTPVPSTTVVFSTEGSARQVVLGRPDGVTPLVADVAPGAAGPANSNNDQFQVGPVSGAPVFVFGDQPTGTPTGDSLFLQLGAATVQNFTTAGAGNGTYTFNGAQPLTFRSIESLAGLQVRATAIQTGPGVGAEQPSDNGFAVRFTAAQSLFTGTTSGATNVLTPSLSGSGTINNPFVVSPNGVNPNGGFGPPRVLFADVDGDNLPDLILANGPGQGPLVTVIRGSVLLNLRADGKRAGDYDAAGMLLPGKDGSVFSLQTLRTSDLIAQFNAYEPDFLGGVSVAAADLDGDGKAELVVGAGDGGGPLVRVFAIDTRTVDQKTAKENADFAARTDPDKLASVVSAFAGTYRANDGTTGRYAPGLPLNGFAAIDPDFRGGVNVAVGDVDGDGVPDLVTGAGVGGGPRVTVYSGTTGKVIQNFFAYDANFRGGVLVDAGRFTGSAAADVVTAPGGGGGPNVRVFDLTLPDPDKHPVANFFAYDPSTAAMNSLIRSETSAGGVGGVAFGPSTDGSGGNRTILVGTGRGTAAEVYEFTPTVATATTGVAQGQPIAVKINTPAPGTIPPDGNTDPTKIRVTRQVQVGSPDDLADGIVDGKLTVDLPISSLTDGTTVAGFTSSSSTGSTGTASGG